MRCFTEKWQEVTIEKFTAFLNEYVIWYNIKKLIIIKLS